MVSKKKKRFLCEILGIFVYFLVLNFERGEVCIGFTTSKGRWYGRRYGVSFFFLVREQQLFDQKSSRFFPKTVAPTHICEILVRLGGIV